MPNPKTTGKNVPTRRATQGYEYTRRTFPVRAQKFGTSMPSPKIILAATGRTIPNKTAIDAMKRSICCVARKANGWPTQRTFSYLAGNT
jgi:hypothetical protein